MSKAISQDLYRSILRKITDEICRGKRTIEESYRKEVLQTHWNIGKILEEPFAGEFENSSTLAARQVFSTTYPSFTAFIRYCRRHFFRGAIIPT
jgi:hypothetical protein